MTVFKKNEKVAVTIDLKEVFDKAFMVLCVSAGMLMMGLFGLIAEYYGLDDIFCYVCMGLVVIIGLSALVAMLCEVFSK